MSQSLSKLYTHIIFHIQRDDITILPEHAHELYAYIGSVLKSNQCHPIQIGGMPDHIHILCTLSKNIALSKLVEEVKRHSSRWIKGKGARYHCFAWQ
ncbi:MAG: transposase [Mediterranea sp.]|nr:transposase [Mediterranea sp.]